jgi:hypothetical protein
LYQQALQGQKILAKENGAKKLMYERLEVEIMAIRQTICNNDTGLYELITIAELFDNIAPKGRLTVNKNSRGSKRTHSSTKYMNQTCKQASCCENILVEFPSQDLNIALDNIDMLGWFGENNTFGERSCQLLRNYAAHRLVQIYNRKSVHDENLYFYSIESIGIHLNELEIFCGNQNSRAHNILPHIPSLKDRLSNLN